MKLLETGGSAPTPRLEMALDLGTGSLLWIVVSLLAIALVGDPPYATLALALLGGVLVGVETHRTNEARVGNTLAGDGSSALDAILHWSVIGFIAISYAWFVFADRPPLLGLLPLTALLIVRVVRRRTLFSRTPLDLPIVLLVLLTLVSGFAVSVDRSLSLPKVYGLLISVLAYYEVAHGARSPGNLTRWLVALSLLGIGMATVGLLGSDWFATKLLDLADVYAIIPRVVTGIPRSLGGGFHPNGVAGTLIFVIPLYAAQAITHWQAAAGDRPQHPRWVHGLTLAALVATAVTLVLTQSRGALLGLGIASVALFWAWKRRWLLSLGSLVGLVALTAVFLIRFPGLLGAVEAAPVGRDVGSMFDFRLATWRAALEVVQAFPFSGAGIGTFDPVVRLLFPHLYPASLYDPSTTITHAHNALLQVAVDLGIPGLVAYVALLTAFARTAWRTYTWAPDKGTRRIILGLGAGMLAHQLFGLTDAFLVGTKPGIVMWIIMGLVTGLYLRLAPSHRARSQDPSPPAA